MTETLVQIFKVLLTLVTLSATMHMYGRIQMKLDTPGLTVLVWAMLTTVFLFAFGILSL